MKRQRIEGSVLAEAVLNKQGRITTLRLLSAPHPDLVLPALRAVQQWRYSPTQLDGKPVEVIFTITVDFALEKARPATI